MADELDDGQSSPHRSLRMALPPPAPRVGPAAFAPLLGADVSSAGMHAAARSFVGSGLAADETAPLRRVASASG